MVRWDGAWAKENQRSNHPIRAQYFESDEAKEFVTPQDLLFNFSRARTALRAAEINLETMNDELKKRDEIEQELNENVRVDGTLKERYHNLIMKNRLKYWKHVSKDSRSKENWMKQKKQR